MKNRRFWMAAIASFILDQLTKFWVVQNFSLGETYPIWTGVFHFTYVTNTGAAFSLFAGEVGWLRWLSLAVSLLLIAWAYFGPPMKPLEQWGYGIF
jgi:signal peptidase II